MKKIMIPALCFVLFAASCKKKDTTATTTPVATAKDINTATKVSIDRFSAAAGHLMLRSSGNTLPAANVAVNFDVAPFITHGLDRTGANVTYYNFDVQPSAPGNIYVFFKSGATTPIAGQNNIIPTIPGDAGYSDFWLVNKVTVPDSYVPNSITSEAAVLASGYTLTKTNSIVNCPVVPFGSTASRSSVSGTASALTLGWYKDMAVAYYTFSEAAVTTTSAGLVPLSPIYVIFANNSSPANGFKVETVNMSQTHNVLATLPADATYSPLWNVNVIDSSHFSMVTNLTTATSFTSMAAGATVNCPIIK
jgi:hypothetical protein